LQSVLFGTLREAAFNLRVLATVRNSSSSRQNSFSRLKVFGRSMRMVV
jgi:hypothetical protein